MKDTMTPEILTSYITENKINDYNILKVSPIDTKLQEHLYNKAFIDLSYYEQNLLPCLIDGFSYKNSTFKKMTNEYKYYSIQGNCYEKNEDVKYESDISLIYKPTGEIVKKVKTNNGYFKFENLSNVEYDIKLIDETGKYTGKYIENVKGYLDEDQIVRIIPLNKSIEIYDEEYKFIFKVKYIGEHQVVIENKPSWLILEQVDDELYILHGLPKSLKFSYKIKLYDYRNDNILKSDEYEVNENFNNNYLEYIFNETLNDNNNIYKATLVGTPIYENYIDDQKAIRCKGRTSTLKIPNSPQMEIGTSNFSLSVEFMLKDYNNKSSGAINYILCSAKETGVANNNYKGQIHLCIVDEKFMFRIRNVSNNAWITYTCQNTRVEIGKYYKFSVYFSNNTLSFYINDIWQGDLLNVTTLNAEFAKFGGYIIFSCSDFETNDTNSTDILLYNFKVINGINKQILGLWDYNSSYDKANDSIIYYLTGYNNGIIDSGNTNYPNYGLTINNNYSMSDFENGVLYQFYNELNFTNAFVIDIRLYLNNIFDDNIKTIFNSNNIHIYIKSNNLYFNEYSIRLPQTIENTLYKMSFSVDSGIIYYTLYNFTTKRTEQDYFEYNGEIPDNLSTIGNSLMKDTPYNSAISLVQLITKRKSFKQTFTTDYVPMGFTTLNKFDGLNFKSYSNLYSIVGTNNDIIIENGEYISTTKSSKILFSGLGDELKDIDELEIIFDFYWNGTKLGTHDTFISSSNGSDSYSGATKFTIRFDNSTNKLLVYINGTTISKTSSNDFKANSWNNIRIILRNSLLNIYLNDILTSASYSSTNKLSFAVNNTLTIGSSSYDNTSFNGRLKNLEIKTLKKAV